MTAMELVNRGCRVSIVERNQIASQTSGESSWAGGGIVFPLLPWLYSEPVNALTLNGANFYRDLSQRLLLETGFDANFEQSGFLLLPNFDLEAAVAWCAKHQVPLEAVKASAFGVESPSGENALWLPSVCQVRPPYMMQAMRHWLENNNNVKQVESSPYRPTSSPEA